MQLLAIDPGTFKSAYVVWNGKNIKHKGIVANNDLKAFIKTHHALFDIVLIEMIACYGMPVGQEVFETCTFIGRLEELIDSFGIKHQRVFRKDVKIHHCNSMRASDANIRTALIDRLGKPGTLKKAGLTHGISKDMWAALAIALYWTDTEESRLRSILNSKELLLAS